MILKKQININQAPKWLPPERDEMKFFSEVTSQEHFYKISSEHYEQFPGNSGTLAKMDPKIHEHDRMQRGT